ncbi:hypothetical protein J3P77_14665 [Pseudomonas sp. R1-18]|uniref:hypothetical protein n=1 Tax=Pseudomonas sp. R1-18 TaxID=1632772 RepID=UPI003DAA3FB9
MSSAKSVNGLPEPFVLSYNSQGVGDIDVADPSKLLEVLVGPIDVSQRDRIDLFWGAKDDPVDSYIHSPDAPDTNGIFSLYVNTRWIKPGMPAVRYTYTRYPAGVPEHSPVKNVIVKLSIPGGRDPDPASPYENEKLRLPVITPPGVITSPDGVSVTIHPWENMREGDLLSVYWHGIAINCPALTSAQIGRPVVVTVSRDIIIEAGDSDNIVVRYDIRDVVNNWSRFSLPAYVEVEAGNSSLPAPVAPQAPEMQLDLDKLAGADVQGLVLAHPDITPGDMINFVVERTTAEGITLPPYTASKVVQVPGSFVEFLLPNAQFQAVAQGRVRLKYTVSKSSGPSLRSKSLPLAVRGQAQQLALPVIPQAMNGLLDPTLHNVVTQVPPYYFMAAGNDVTLVWMGKTASGATVMHEERKTLNQDDVGKTVNYLIPDEKLRVLAGGSLEVYYTITTYAKAFFKSPVLKLLVDNDHNAPLPRPRIKEANGDTLDPINAPNGATVIIDASANLRAGERVFTIWQGPKGYGDKDQIVTDAQAGKTLEVVFAPSLVTDNAGEVVHVVYAVYRLNGPMQRSEAIDVTVVDKPLDLPAPRMDTVGADGVLTPSLIPDSGATVRVSYPGMGPQDSVVVQWRGASVHDTPAQTPGGSELLFTLPKALIVATAGAAASVLYTVTRGGAVTASPALPLTVKAGMSFDTSPVALGGKVYLLPGTPDILPQFPDGTTIRRVASGGQTPYTYASSNTLVAQVDHTGLTSVRGNGKAIISATDALGESKSYEVTVTGVIHCLGMGKGSYAQVAAAAASKGARMPSIYELKEIYDAYGSRWPMGNGNYWSSTVAAVSLIGLTWYYVKNLVTGKDFKLMHHNVSLGVALR